jgi:cytoskeletal protein RodZ
MITASAAVSRQKLIDWSTPAKMSFSALIMRALLVLVSVGTVFAWYEGNAVVEVLTVQSTRVINDYRLLNDLNVMGVSTTEEFWQVSSANRPDLSKPRADYNAADAQVLADIDRDGTLVSADDPLSLFKADGIHMQAVTKLKTAFANYHEGINAARMLADASNAKEAFARFQATDQIRSRDLYPATVSLLEVDSRSLKESESSYSRWRVLTKTALYATAAGLLAFLVWQFLFLGFRGKPGAPSAVIVALMLSSVVFAYGFPGIYRFDAALHEDVAQMQVQVAPSAKLSAPVLVTDGSLSLRVKSVQTAQESFSEELSQAEAGVRILVLAPLIFLLVGFIYQLGIKRSLKEYLL